jgi:hypothetical protein
VERPAEPVDECVERVKAAMDVFAEIHTARADVRKHRLKRFDLLMGLMPAVIDQNVDRRDGLAEALPERGASLVPDEDMDVIMFVGPARRFDIDAVDVGSATEVVLPHLKASTAEDADLD